MDRDEWLALAAHHADRAAAALDERHHNPIEDFLWTYYSTRPSHLLIWHPGAGTLLRDGAREYGLRRGYLAIDLHATVDPGFIHDRWDMIKRTHDLLIATESRPAQYGCFGMHEWAMVYGLEPEEVRHSTWPLRFNRERNQQIVDELGARCSHFDAFRFFTPPARPLNLLQPTRESQILLEQPGCIHANMDLLKWALKLMPMIPSSLLLEAFINARALRMLDMQASPYDLSELGVAPVRVETAEGRSEYRNRQRELAEESVPIRRALIQWCELLLDPRFGRPAVAQETVGNGIIQRHP